MFLDEYFSVFSSLESSEECKQVCVTNRDKFGRQKVCVPGAAENIQPILGLQPAKRKIENFHETFRIKITFATDANLESNFFRVSECILFTRQAVAKESLFLVHTSFGHM